MDSILQSFKFMRKISNMAQAAPTTEICGILNTAWGKSEEHTVAVIERVIRVDVHAARKVLELMRSV